MAVKGKLVVIDGIDGSGKKTQSNLLRERLIKMGKKSVAIDFPRYENNFFGRFIADCQNKKYGNFLDLNPYIASVLYAADRWETKEEIKRKLEQGYIIICDRYVSANQIHQGGKIINEKKRKIFFQWLEKMEFNIFEIPNPDLIVYLDMPIKNSIKLIKSKENLAKRKYLKGRIKIYKNDITYLEKAKKSAEILSKTEKNWIRISCTKNGKLIAKEKISDTIFLKIKTIIND